MASSLIRRVAAATAAACTIAAGVIGGTVADADPAGNYVAFGDSFAANPGPQDPAPVMGRGGCPQSPSNIGSHVAAQTALELHDYSCNGAVVYMNEQKGVNAQVDNAIGQGSVGPETKLVTFFVGANDTMQNFIAPKEIQDDLFQQKMTEAINKVKDKAPQAKIMVIGYPEFTSRDEAHYACFINFNGFAPHLNLPPVHDLEMNLQARQERAAHDTGTQFLNLKDVSNVNVAMCAPDGQRQVSAILDSDTASYNMTNHPTFYGSEVIGTTIANAYKAG